MPIATPEIYAQMLDRAKEQGFAYPSINRHLQPDAERGHPRLCAGGQRRDRPGLDGRRRSTCRAGGQGHGHRGRSRWRTLPARSAARYPVHIALHTDHCPKDKLGGYMRPLVQISRERVERGEEPLFQSHMWDGSAVPLAENLQIADELLTSAPPPASSWRWRSASSAARRTAWSAR